MTKEWGKITASPSREPPSKKVRIPDTTRFHILTVLNLPIYFPPPCPPNDLKTSLKRGKAGVGGREREKFQRQRDDYCMLGTEIDQHRRRRSVSPSPPPKILKPSLPKSTFSLSALCAYARDRQMRHSSAKVLAEKSCITRFEWRVIFSNPLCIEPRAFAFSGSSINAEEKASLETLVTKRRCHRCGKTLIFADSNRDALYSDLRFDARFFPRWRGRREKRERKNCVTRTFEFVLCVSSLISRGKWIVLHLFLFAFSFLLISHQIRENERG